MLAIVRQPESEQKSENWLENWKFTLGIEKIQGNSQELFNFIKFCWSTNFK